MKGLGLKDEKIATNAHLLGLNPKIVEKNYELLRRFLSREKILDNPNLLGNSPKTVEASVQMLTSMGIDYESASAGVLGTTTKRKREKLAVLMREQFGYSPDLTKEERLELAQKARNFCKKRPQILLMGEQSIKKRFAEPA